MKIYKRQSEGKIERFVTADLNGLPEDELELLREFNLLQFNEFVILFQRNPARKDETTFVEEHLRLEVEYRGDLLRIFAVNDIQAYIDMMDHTQSEMSEKEVEIAEIVESLKVLPGMNVLSSKKTKPGKQ